MRMRVHLVPDIGARPAGRSRPVGCRAGARSPARLRRQTPFVPYFGKNNIHYDKFDWHIYTTDHFEIYYYPDLEKHLERVAGYAESAYQQVSADLKHDLSFKVPLILFKTHSEFEQQNVAPGAAQEGVGAFAEPYRDRMLLPIDDPPDRLYGLIAHELTHIFEFDIIPQGLIRRSVPLWVNEGLSDYERGQWAPLDLMMVRDAAVADIVPKMSELAGLRQQQQPAPHLQPRTRGVRVHRGEVRQGRHPPVPLRAAQERHRRRRGRLRGSAQDEARRVRPGVRALPEGALQAVPRQGAAGRLRPRPRAESRRRRSTRRRCRSRPSPSGDLIAVVTVNRKDGELDIVLLSSKDGSVVRNLTRGLRQELRLRPPRDARRALEHDAVDGVVAEGRPARLLRAHREGAHAHRAERADAEDRGRGSR